MKLVSLSDSEGLLGRLFICLDCKNAKINPEIIYLKNLSMKRILFSMLTMNVIGAVCLYAYSRNGKIPLWLTR